MKNNKAISQLELTKEFFHNNPNKDIPHSVFRSWAEREYIKRTGHVLADPDRGVRKLSQEGYLIKVRKGFYRYEPGSVHKRELEDFKPAVKKAIFERDGYRCVICGKGPKEGFEIQADHIKQKIWAEKQPLRMVKHYVVHITIVRKNLVKQQLEKSYL